MNPNNREYTNGEVTVFWKPSKCIHATTCFRELIEVFNPRKRPWINMKGASTDKIIQVVDKCPTQAISWKWNKDIDQSVHQTVIDEGEELTPEDMIDNKDKDLVLITLMKDGPILAEGSFKILDASGNELKTMIMTSFCRCGNSRNQPYCDGTHRKVGFSG